LAFVTLLDARTLAQILRSQNPSIFSMKCKGITLYRLCSEFVPLGSSSTRFCLCQRVP
jgi:hypothetical protein